MNRMLSLQPTLPFGVKGKIEWYVVDGRMKRVAGPFEERKAALVAYNKMGGRV